MHRIKRFSVGKYRITLYTDPDNFMIGFGTTIGGFYVYPLPMIILFFWSSEVVPDVE